jgi:hypothetical protein
MINNRNIALCIVLSIVTCGIYGIYWFVVMTNDVKTAANDTELASGGLAFFLTLITCGIYGIYWAYKMGELMSIAQQKRNLPVKDNAIIYLILEIFGLAIVNYILIQNDLNTIATMTEK